MEDILNFDRMATGIYTGGQPTEAQLAAAKSCGIELVVNLGLSDGDYALPDERGLVEGLGMKYVQIPVEFSAPTLEQYRIFEATLVRSRAKATLVHCALNWRGTSFGAMYGRRQLGWTNEATSAYRRKFWDVDSVWESWAEAVLASAPNQQ